MNKKCINFNNLSNISNILGMVVRYGVAKKKTTDEIIKDVYSNIRKKISEFCDDDGNGNMYLDIDNESAENIAVTLNENISQSLIPFVKGINEMDKFTDSLSVQNIRNIVDEFILDRGDSQVSPDEISSDNVRFSDVFKYSKGIPDFKQKMYGSQVPPYKRMEAIFNNIAMKSIFIKGSGSNAVIVNPESVEFNIAVEKISMMKDIIDWIASVEPDNKKILNIKDLISEVYSSVSNDNASINDRLADMNRLINEFDIYKLLELAGNEFSKHVKISNLSRYVYSNNKADRMMLDAYNKAFILANFDELIDEKLNGIIDISYYGQKTIYKDMKMSDEYSRLHTTWTDNDDVVSAIKECGGITKIILESMMYYNSGVKSSRKMGFNEINDAIGSLKNFTFNQDSDINVIVGKNVYNLRDAIISLNRNPINSLKILTDIITNGFIKQNGDKIKAVEYISSKIYNNVSDIISISRKKALENNLYSLFANIVDLGLYETNKKSVYNPNLPNYFSYVANYVRGAYRTVYTQRYSDLDDNGMIKTISLSDKPSDESYKQIERSIYSSSSAIEEDNKILFESILSEYDNSKSYSIENNFRNDDGSVNGAIKDEYYIKMNNIPFKRYDGSVILLNAELYTKVNGDGKKAGRVILRNAENGSAIYANDLFPININPYIDNSNFMDELIENTFMINTTSNIDLKKYLYKNQNSMMQLFESCLVINMMSNINNDIFNDDYFDSKVKIENSIKRYFQQVKDDLYPVKPLLFEKGINNTPTYIYEAKRDVVSAIITVENKTSRDTVLTGENTTLSVTGMQRLINTMDEQIDMIRKSNDSPAKLNVMSMKLNEIIKNVAPTINVGNALDSNEYVYLGNEIERETNLNGINKKRSDFNVSECIAADILLSYLDDTISTDKDYYSFVTSTNSDKTQIHRTKVNSKFINTLRNMSKSDRINFIKNAYKVEFNKVYDNISKEFDKINDSINNILSSDEGRNAVAEYIKSSMSRSEALNIFPLLDNISGNKNLSKIITPDDNFESFNNLCFNSNINNSYDAIMSLVKIANRFGANVKLIDQAHLQQVKGTDILGNKITSIRMNPGIMSQLFVYNMGEKSIGNNIYDNANENVYNKFGITLSGEPGKCKIDTFENILNRNNVMSVYYSMKDYDFKVNLYDANGKLIGFKGFNKYISENSDWFTPSKMILMKYNGINITSMSDMRKNGMVDDNDIFIADINNVEVNPLFEEFNTISGFISDNSISIQTGASFNHILKKDKFTFESLMSALENAQTKRNVSNTASIHPLTLKSLDGLDDDMRISVITDITEFKSSYAGSNKNVSTHDGGAYMHPLSLYWWNNSMNDNKSKGYILKPFIHFYDESTMTGGIIKSAVFALTNDTIRMSKTDLNMAKKFMDNVWMDEFGVEINGNIFDYSYRNWSSNGNKNLLQYIMDKHRKGMFYRDDYYVYKIDRIEYDKETGEYIRYRSKVYDYKSNNNIFEKAEPERFKINSNFGLWNLFGGQWSMNITESGSFENSESSLRIVSDIASCVGTKNGKPVNNIDEAYGIETQADVYQFMKKSDIHMFVTNGAIKQGAANINKHEDIYFDKRNKPSSFVIKLQNAGIQLDKSHNSDGGMVSELTQVMSALSSMGYTKELADSVYKAMGNIVESSIDSIINRHRDINGDISYNDVAAELVVRAMSESNSFDDEIRERCKSIINRYDKGEKISYNDIVSLIDINDNVFVSKATPVIMSIINKSSIKKKYSGGLFVIAPSYGRVQLYGDKLYGQLGISDNVKAENLIAIQRESDLKPLRLSSVRMQHVYKVIDNDGKTIQFNGKNHLIVNSYDDYINLKKTVLSNEGSTIHEVFMEYTDENDYNYDLVYEVNGNKKYITAIGRELAQDDYRFDVVLGNDINSEFNLMDMHSTKMMFIAKNDINKIDMMSIYNDIDIMCRRIAESMSSINGVNENDIYYNILNNITGPMVDRDSSVKNFIKAARTYHQIELDSISKSSKDNNRHNINLIVGDNVENATIILGSLKYTPHETISPNVNRTKFGLSKETRISDVTPELFAKNFIDNFRVRTDSDLYHYALLHGSGRHILIYDTILARKDVSFDGKGLNKLNDSMFYHEKGTGYKYRIDKNGNKLYRIRDTDEVYTNGREEIIRTDKPSDILKTMSFMGMRISPSVYYDNKGRKTIDKRYIESTNKYIITTLMSSKFVKINDKETGSRSVSYWLSNVNESRNEKRIDLLLSMAFKDFNEGDSSVNNYTQEILLNELNSNGIEYFNKKRNINGLYGYIYDNAISVYNSFMMSLNILAARTPSQTMQSYMSMRNTEFETSGMNTCYVATSQIWFQGSDFDIDAVTFQEYAIDDRGQFIGWSPYFQNTTLKESLLLPFPTGFELNKRVVKKEAFNTNENRSRYIKLFNSVFIEDIDNVTKISRYKVRDNARLEDKAAFLNECNKNGIIAIPAIDGTADSDSYDAVTSFVNEHNTYINDNPNASSMMKNYITYNSIRISSDLSNLIESESSVDDSKVISKLGDNNKSAGMRQDDTYGNFTNRYAAFFSNMVGKDVVAISAAGLKNFFAITHYYNTISTIDTYNVFNEYFNNEDYEKALMTAFALINKIGIGPNGMGLIIGGRIYNTSSNFNPSDTDKEFIIDIYNKISTIDENTVIYEGKIKCSDIVSALRRIVNSMVYGKFNVDEALMLSELLSEATDNAKNLNLSKINATSEMAPLYIFGLTIGMDIEDIYNIMTSKTAQMIDKIRSSNVFYGVNNNLSIESIRDNIISEKAYIKIPVELEDRSGSFFNIKIKDIVDSDTSKSLLSLIGDQYKTISIKDIISSSLSLKKYVKNININVNNDMMNKIVDAIENSYNKLNDSKLNGLFFNFTETLRNILDYRHIYNSEVKDTGNDYINSLINLEKGNKEMLKLALISGINKGVKATQKDISSHRMKLSELMTYNSSANQSIGSFMAKHKTNPIIKDGPSTTYMFDFNEFNRNVRYREDSKIYYNAEFRHAFNVIDMIDSMHNFKAYSKAVNESNNIINSISSKKKISDDIVEAIQSYIKIPMSSTDKDAIIKSVNLYINNILFNSWLNNREAGPIKISVPKGYTYFVKNSDGKLKEEINKSDEPEIVYLGTEAGNASFIKLMYDLIIPNIKRGYLDDNKTIHSNDFDRTFMNNLRRASSNKVYSKATMHLFAPFTNSRSNDAFDMMRIEEGKASMKSLNDIKYKNGDNEYSIGNLMYLYNELLYSGNLSRHSMEIYFDETPLKSEYLKYDKEVASSTKSFIKNILGDKFEINDSFMRDIAPFVSTYRSNLPYVKYFDSVKLELGLYKYSKKSRKNNLNDDYDNDNNENAEAIEDDESRAFVRYGYDHFRYAPVREFDSSPYSMTSRSFVNDISMVSDNNSKTIKLRGINDNIDIIIKSKTNDIILNTSSNTINITDDNIKDVLLKRFKLNNINNANDLYSISYGALKTYVSNIINQKLNCE